MKKYFLIARTVLLLAASSHPCYAQVQTTWKIHDLNRPLPPVIDPATASTQESPGRAPSDAVVLFDGKNLSRWIHKDGTAAKWKVEMRKSWRRPAISTRAILSAIANYMSNLPNQSPKKRKARNAATAASF